MNELTSSHLHELEPTVFAPRSWLDQRAYERPNTVTNRLLAGALRYAPHFYLITEREVREWILSARQEISILLGDRRAVNEAIEEAQFVVLPETPRDPNIWMGEVVFNENKHPTVIVYQGLITQLPSPCMVRTAGVSFGHHVLGHIVPRKLGHGCFP